MSNLEYYVTISAFVAGIILLAYLFRIRATLARGIIIRLRMVQEKAKSHYTYQRPPVDNSIEFEPDETLDFSETIAHIRAFDDVWGPEHTRKRDIR